MNSFKRIVQFTVAAVMCLPAAAHGDQTDQRLDALFQTLQSSQDDTILLETEAAIWDIWYDSGEQHIDSLMQQAAGLARTGDLAGAESIYSQVIERLPRFSEGWNRRATVRFYQKDFDGSLDDIEQTLKLEPRHFGAVWGLGMILGTRQDYTRAIEAFERLLEIKPNAHDIKSHIELLQRELAKGSV